MNPSSGVSNNNQLSNNPVVENYDTVAIGGGPAGMLFLLTTLGVDPFFASLEPSDAWLPSGKICSLPGPPSLAFGAGQPNYDHYLTESGTEDSPRSERQKDFESKFKAAQQQHSGKIVSHAGALATKITFEKGSYTITFSVAGEEKVCTAKRLVIATGHSRKTPYVTCWIAHLQGSEGLCKKLQECFSAVQPKSVDSVPSPNDCTLRAAAFKKFIESLPTTNDGKKVIAVVGDGPSMDEVLKILYKEHENVVSHPSQSTGAVIGDSKLFEIVIFSSKCKSDIAKNRQEDWIRNLAGYTNDKKALLTPAQQLANDAWKRVNSGDKPEAPNDYSAPNGQHEGTYNLARRLLKLEADKMLTVCGRLDWSTIQKNAATGTFVLPKTPLLSSKSSSSTPGSHTEPSQETTTSQPQGNEIVQLLELSVLIDCAPMPQGTHDKGANGKFIPRSQQHRILDDLITLGHVGFDDESKTTDSSVGVLKSENPHVLLIGAAFARKGLSLDIWKTQSTAAVDTLRTQELKERSNPLEGESFSRRTTEFMPTDPTT